jgi:hypothetical protein
VLLEFLTKVDKKINGATQFAVLRSVIDTARKNAQDVFAAFMLIASIDPE